MLIAVASSAASCILVGVLASYALTWVARLIAPALGLIDKPDQNRKRHAHPTPVMGGVAVYASIIVTTVLFHGYLFAGGSAPPFVYRLLISAGLFCLLGVVDDKIALRPRTKLLGQILASLPFVIGAEPVSTVQFLGVQVHLGAFGSLFAVLWLVACTNIVNLIDGLDGLASTICLVAAVTIAALAAITGEAVTMNLSLIVAAAVVGFLAHNWPPAKIFLGDGGSLPLGFLVGALAFEASLKTAAVFTLTVPAVVMSVPAFDTLMAIVRRRLTGRGIGEGDRGHIHHRLQDKGLTKLQTLMAIGGLSLLVSVAAILAMYFDNDFIAAAACFGIFSIVVVSRLLGFRETQLVFRHVQALQGLLWHTLGVAGTRFWLTRIEEADAPQLESIWHEAFRRLEKSGIHTLEISCDRQGTQSLLYQHISPDAQSAPTESSHWQVAYSIRREDDSVITASSHGISPSSERIPRTDDLFTILHGLCIAWPLDVDAAIPTIIAFPSGTRYIGTPSNQPMEEREPRAA